MKIIFSLPSRRQGCCTLKKWKILASLYSGRRQLMLSFCQPFSHKAISMLARKSKEIPLKRLCTSWLEYTIKKLDGTWTLDGGSKIKKDTRKGKPRVYGKMFDLTWRKYFLPENWTHSLRLNLSLDNPRSKMVWYEQWTVTKELRAVFLVRQETTTMLLSHLKDAWQWPWQWQHNIHIYNMHLWLATINTNKLQLPTIKKSLLCLSQEPILSAQQPPEGLCQVTSREERESWTKENCHTTKPH